ncbi:RNA polymerase-associated protein RapA [Echinimonas agarilytica]|uniref:RNA polymerase-associated protein RapA n=1 Tax=Echinimonas agarilytica TaxID=1215918 RepID=A0AA41W904_9GAMM|nr:RNA polymerase-associated protein RapA [Echinimonas agarilytica]MCM2681285.1 RNA polymerase-associated protein RapA [Echinimonas agarilytica]
MSHAIGQRWLSDNESELGIGILTALDARTITLYFPATEERRVYSIKDAPITRLAFAVNDTVSHVEDWQLKITELKENNGVIYYIGDRVDTGETTLLVETELSPNIVVNQPQDRLFAGQLDRMEQFNLRHQCLQNRARLQSSPIRGLNGARIGLIPHQLHIAKEAGQRFAPRLLLADEVGLGKTIEAGLILHQQLLTERAQRVLILVPESLQHQWLVELLRRFNIQVALFDEARIQESLDEALNPFESAQIVLCSQRLMNKRKIHDAAVEAEWDLLVVDEAHHLTWEDGKPGRNYQQVAQLAEQTPGLLLLTATPDQLGHEGHFARLRLLDPNRFHDYQSFVAEENSYRDVADAANALLDEQALTQAQLTLLNELISENDIEPLLRCIQDDSVNADQRQSAKDELLELLLDRHGTSRVLFRNTRAAVKGFPKRNLTSYALEMPAAYKTAMKLMGSSEPQERLIQLLTPETCYGEIEGSSEAWLNIDPRVDWLLNKLAELKPHKVLLICSQKRTVLQLAETMRERTGMHVSTFHEDMSIVERDRAAAHFADEYDGTQVLLCSEIGSEGRNFQFAHHLVLFDLPLNPDLLEQRIGRLDRIGQRHDINIHVPCLTDSAQIRLLDWLHQGLNALESTLSIGKKIFDEFEQSLVEGLLMNLDSEHWEQLIHQTKTRRMELIAELEKGRDRLLELGSCGQKEAEQLISDIAAQDDETELPQFMLKLWDVYGVNQDEKGEKCIALMPTEGMLGAELPGLPDDGATITFDRTTALSREDVQFLSWDHPMVAGAVDAILGTPTGSTNVAIIKNRGLPNGSYMLQLLYTLQVSAPGSLQLGRFLSSQTIRILLDKTGNDLADKVSFEQLAPQLSPIGRHTGTKLVAALRQFLPDLILNGEAKATVQSNAMTAQALTKADQYFRHEIDRLTALKAVNPSVRDEEIEFLEQQAIQAQAALSQAQLRIEGVQLIVVNHS